MKFLKSLLSTLSSQFRSATHSLVSSYKAAPPEMQKSARRIIGIALLIVVVMTTYRFLSERYEEHAREIELAKGPKVQIAKVIETPADRSVKLTGEARPFASVTLYAKVSGYLKKVLVDKGDVVKKGQMLAIIESPETDKAYNAALSEARNKKAIADRIQKLFQRSLVSQQEADQAASDSEVASAHLESQEVLKSYETLRAPFAGTITQRFADPGALMQNATGSQTSALPVLSISQVNELRVYAYLDQRDASAVDKGAVAEVTLSERPDEVFAGHVTRLSGALDEKTRMLLTEIDLDNKDKKILPGSLVQVTIHAVAAPGFEVPSEAVVLREGKTMVGVVGEDSTVDLIDVRVLDNDGQKIRVATGLKPGMNVALNLGGSVKNHGKIQIMGQAPGAKK